MSEAEQKVKERWPRAWCSQDYHSRLGRVMVVWESPVNFHALSFAKTTEEAWIKAAKQLENAS